MSAVTLAATLHDPDDRQLDQALRVLPALRQRYAALVVVASPQTTAHSRATLADAGVAIVAQAPGAGSLETLGLVRRQTLAAALDRGASHLHLCDWDRVIHWAEHWPAELAEVVAAIPSYDCLILGRTTRAWATHPQVQRDTEALINHVFGLAWGQPLDITAASRGLSARAAQHLLAHCPEPTIGNDGAWPLALARDPALVIGYAATEGLEWETPDRYADEIAAVGGLDAWLAHFDHDLDHWATRLKLAQLEAEAIGRWRLACEP